MINPRLVNDKYGPGTGLASIPWTPSVRRPGRDAAASWRNDAPTCRAGKAGSSSPWATGGRSGSRTAFGAQGRAASPRSCGTPGRIPDTDSTRSVSCHLGPLPKVAGEALALYRVRSRWPGCCSQTPRPTATSNHLPGSGQRPRAVRASLDAARSFLELQHLLLTCHPRPLSRPVSLLTGLEAIRTPPPDSQRCQLIVERRRPTLAPDRLPLHQPSLSVRCSPTTAGTPLPPAPARPPDRRWRRDHTLQASRDSTPLPPPPPPP